LGAAEARVWEQSLAEQQQLLEAEAVYKVWGLVFVQPAPVAFY